MRTSFFPGTAGVRNQRERHEIEDKAHDEDFVRRDQQTENRRNRRQYGDRTPEVANASDTDGTEAGSKEPYHREFPKGSHEQYAPGFNRPHRC